MIDSVAVPPKDIEASFEENSMTSRNPRLGLFGVSIVSEIAVMIHLS